MLSETTITFRPLLVLTLFIVLTGCAARPVYLVDDADLSSLESQLQSQATELAAVKQMLEAVNQELQKQAEEAEQTQPVVLVKPVEPANRQVKAAPRPSRKSKQADNGKMVVGQLEKFYLYDPGFIYRARIDSGAETSSLDARNITRFERDGENWVRFDVPVPGHETSFVTLERKLVRNVRVIQSAADDSERRAVVELQFAIGSHRQKAEFTLSTRDNLKYPVLVGRNILRDVMVVDVGKKYATKLPDSLVNKQGPKH